jgi:(2Fe-2S) ferredoxin
LKVNKLLKDDRVLVAQTGCLYPCNLGPLLVVYPDGVWYGRLNEAAIDRIITEHFLGHQVVDDHVVHRLGTIAQT